MPKSHTIWRKETIVTLVFFAVIVAFSTDYVRRLATPKPPSRRPAATRTHPETLPASQPFSLQQCITGIEKWAESVKISVDEFIDVQTDLWIHFAELNMRTRKWAGMKLIPGDWTVVQLPNGHLATYRNPSDTVRCARELIHFREFVEQQGSSFLFVMVPYKNARHGGQMPEDYPDYVSENARRFLKRLKKSDVPLLDLRISMEQDGKEFFSHFFKTDHHWKPEVGLWASATITAELHRRFDFPFDPETLDPNQFQIDIAEKALLGSFGRKVTLAYADPEDFSLVTPIYPTDCSVQIPGTRIDRRGSFGDVMIHVNTNMLAARNYYKGNPYAYMYGNRALIHVHNHLRHDGHRVLVIKDSFSNFVTPFQSLTTEYLDIIDPRHFTGSIREYIQKTRPDVVLVQYYAENISTSSRRRKDRVDLFLFD